MRFTIPSLATVINFCSNDYPFLMPCIDAVKPFSAQILIPVCDHFFDGTPENRETLEQIYAENSDINFIEFPFDPRASLYGSHSAVTWHNLARILGRFFVKEEIEYILFLDCDEIADTQRFIAWLETFPWQQYHAMQLLNYWYFRESRFQATSWEHTPLLVKKSVLSGPAMHHPYERGGMYDAIEGNKLKGAAGLDQLPLFHHFSWVRTKEQLLRKVCSWGHHEERNWASLVEEEFSRPFSGKDFVHGYTFNEVEPPIPIDLRQQPRPLCNSNFSHVRRLSNEEVTKIDVSITFDLHLCL